MKFQGQMWGGPEHGDIIDSDMERIAFVSEAKLWIDGALEKPSVKKVHGIYTWNPEMGRFDWEGPGADGDTIERLRLRP